MGKILTFGEPLLAFHIPPSSSVSTTGGNDSFMSLAGSEINTCVALHRLGHDITLLTVLPDNDLGKYYKQILEDIGISTKYVLFAEGTMGTMYIKDQQVSYDRYHSAFYHMDPMLFPIQEIFKEKYDWIHLTGITPSLSIHNINVWKTILQHGIQSSTRISIDLNHRPSLIECKDLWKIIKPYVSFIEILFVSKENIPELLSMEHKSSISSFLQSLQIKQLLYCIKEPQDNDNQSRSSILFQSNDTIQSIPIVQCVKEPIGGGDTYSAAFIDASLIKNLSIQDTLHYCDLTTIQSQNHRGHFLPPIQSRTYSP